MLTFIAAAALAAQTSAPAVTYPMAQHAQNRQGEAPQHKDCCKDCCEEMGKGEHDVHAPDTQPQRSQ